MVSYSTFGSGLGGGGGGVIAPPPPLTTTLGVCCFAGSTWLLVFLFKHTTIIACEGFVACALLKFLVVSKDASVRGSVHV